MPRIRAFPSAALVAAAAAVAWLGAAGIAAQQVQVQGAPQRDVNAQPQMRPIPVGTASISGTVTSADGGKPVRDAVVRINGAAMVPDGALPALTSETMGLGRGSGPASMSLAVNRSVATDASGRFSFQKLPAGHFTLNVSKSNYLATNFGQKRPGASGTTIVVADGQAFTANATLMRGGVITGTIFGPDGEPMPRVQVGAWRYQISPTGRRFSQNNSVTTDDRGMYRIANLQPGDYLIGATPNGFELQMAARMNPGSSEIEQAIATGTVRPPASPGLPSTVLVPTGPQIQSGMSMSMSMDTAGYLPTYFPGTPSRAGGQMIHVAGGDEHAAADFTAQYVEAGSINVTVASPLKPGVAVRVSLISADPDFDNNSFSYSDQSSKITLRAIPPGSYTVMAQTALSPQFMNRGASSSGPPPQLADEDKQWGSAVVNVSSGAPAAVSISLHPGRAIGGVVVFDMSRPPDLARARMNVMLSAAPGSAPAMGPPPQAPIEPDGRFTIAGVAPGRYSLRVNGGSTKSAMVGSVDTLDFPFEFPATEDVTDAVLTVTDKFAELSGLLTESAGKPAMDYMIIAASTDERFWTANSRRISLARTGADGKYIFRSLPPGDYYVVVVSDLDAASMYDPEFLRSLSAAGTRVRVSDGGKTTQDLRVK